MGSVMSGDIPLALNRDRNRCPRCRSLNCITDHEITDTMNRNAFAAYQAGETGAVGLMQMVKSTWR